MGAKKRKCSHEETAMVDVTGGRKNDSGKLRYDLDSVPATRERVAVLTHGAQKYGDRNWEQGIKYSRIYAALQRHLTAFWDGEDMDQESGLSHLAHASCELMFLQHFAVERDNGNYIELDDRPVINEEVE